VRRSDESSGRSRIRLGGAHHVADPDIRLGGAHHVVDPDIRLA